MTTEEKAIEAYKKVSLSGRVLLEHIFGKKLFKGDVMERIQSFNDVLDEHGMTAEYFESQQIYGLPKDVQVYIKLKLIVAAYNEGWKPNWRDANENKYEVWVTYESLLRNANRPVDVRSFLTSCSSDVRFGSRLVFKNREHAIRAGELFTDLWRYWFIEE